MTTLRQRMIDAMVLLGFRPRTQVSYLKAVSQIARYYHRNPELITDQEVQAYLREPPYGSDGPLRGDEFMAADVADGSAAPVRDSEMQPFTFDFAGSAFAIRE
jgi:hypothetical protein